MQLLHFPHSHFCEKARWALDYKGLQFTPVALLPGFHVKTVRRYGPRSSVPLLLNGPDIIQGSGAIIDYLDARYPEYPLTPADPTERDLSIAIEAEMDDRLGRPIRQILYFWLLAHPSFLQHCFTHTLPFYKKAVFRLTYPLLRKIIYRGYVISEESVEQALVEFDAVLADLATRLQGRRYLVGNGFSRGDLTVASMLSLLALPPEHPLPWREIPDRTARQFIDGYHSHPVTEWVREMYRKHRPAQNRRGEEVT